MEWELLDFETEKHVQKDTRDIKRCMRLEYTGRRTKIYVVAKSYEDEENEMLFLPSYIGIPITQEVYDSVRDGFVVYAADYCDVGTVPIAYRLVFDDSGWDIDIPIPVPVIRRYLDDTQKKILDVWKSRFCKEKYFFESVQLLEVY